MVDKVSFKERLSAQDPLQIKSIPVIQNIPFIQHVSVEATMEEAEAVWPILEASLDPKAGYGLSAIQIGIMKKIGFVRYNGKDYHLLNTRIIEKHGPFIMGGEGCLSIPGKHCNTIRYSRIIIEDDVLGRVFLNESSDGLLSIIFQHEVDHFEGITILDRLQKPVINTNKIGRNSLCLCGSGKKYKKCCINV